MSTTVVTPPAAAAAVPAAAPPAAPATPPPDSAALQQRITALEQEAAETKRAAEYWHAKANERPAPPKEAPKEDVDEPKVDFLDLATQGSDAVDKYLAKWAKKQGYIKKSEAEELSKSSTAQLSREQRLTKKYPDLEDHDSEMFKTTASRYGELVKNGVAEGIAMEMAAESAELALIRAGKIKTPAEKAAAKEADRLARIAAQGGDRGGRSAVSEEEDTELDDAQKRIALGILRGETDENGKPLTDDQIFDKYKARAKKGVQRFGKAA